ncbi:hypothetical protein TNCV_2037131 [Trichonephila clavipes]|nr:hypothetical protein TNCV_2037131 [Trichonephila clavipes]
MLEKVIENWTSRLDYIRASRGSPMLEIIFKMSSPPGPQKVPIRHCDLLRREAIPAFPSVVKKLLTS